MKTIINLKLLVLFALLSSTINAQNKKADQDTENFRYEIEGFGTGNAGTYLIKVWSYSKKPNIAIEQAKKNAVHGIIFRGFEGAQSQKPLARNPNAEQQNADFFKEFFNDGGKYLKFVSVINNGAIAPEDRMKIGKEYKIGVIVSVNKDILLKDLEAAGIIKGFGEF